MYSLFAPKAICKSHLAARIVYGFRNHIYIIAIREHAIPISHTNKYIYIYVYTGGLINSINLSKSVKYIQLNV